MTNNLMIPSTEFILSRLGLSYTSVGDNQLLTLCPFHNDHNPSLSIQKDPLLYHCWSCGAKGNWYSLIKNLTGKNPYKFLDISYDTKSNISFYTAFKTYESKKSEKSSEPSTVEFQIIADIIDPYSDPIAKQYCIDRGIDKNDIEKYEIFFIKRGYINRTNFFNRLVIPIKDYKGKIVSYEGRDVTKKAIKKCIYPYQSKVGNTIFQNQHLDRLKPTIFVEGIMDFIVVQKVLPNIQVSTYFGIELSKKQEEIIKEFTNIITMFDPDEAGIDRANSILYNIVEHTFEVCLLSENDPSASSQENIITAYNERISYTELLLINNGLLQPDNNEW